MNLQAANFEDLVAFYYQGTGAYQAVDEIRNARYSGRNTWLAKVLRHHGLEPITDRDEIDFRQCVDDLIVCAGALEIALASQLFTISAAPQEFWADLRGTLHEPHVQNYYTNHYPDRLPQLLLARLEGRFNRTEPQSASAIALDFFALDHRFSRQQRHGIFLQLVDDFTVDGTRFADLVQLLEEPSLLIESILRNDEDTSVLDAAVQQLSEFITFCFQLKELLGSARALPLLQSEIWLYYAYWFNIIGNHLKLRLGRALDAFLKWQAPEATDKAAEEIQHFVAHAKEALDHLVAYTIRVDFDFDAQQHFGQAEC